MSDFGTRLRMAMGYADVSMRELGDHLGVSAMAVSKWASGACYPRSSHLMAICDRCGVSVDWLMQSGDPFTGQDIIEALRKELKDAANESAARIEQLEAENARLQSCVWRADYLAIAAQKLVDVERTHAGCSGIQLTKLSDELALYWKHAGGTPSARAALAGKETGHG